MRLRALLLTAVLVPAAIQAQSLDLMYHTTGISFGDSRLVHGIRLNFRDARMREVVGVNATVWTPYAPVRGVVKGLALGLPITGARSISGLGLAAFGVGAEEDFSGLGAGLIGVGAGRDLSGIFFGRIGAGAGRNMKGITIGGVGAGAGGNMKGIAIGGIGAGAGGNMTGFAGSLVGVGAGGDVRGIVVSGIGAGAGGTLRGLAVGGLGVGAPRVRGIALGLNAGGADVVGGVVAPVYFTIRDDGSEGGYVKGVTLSSWNDIRGEQHGLSIGLLNTAWDLHGWQVGLLNYARNNPKGLRLLPLFNRAW